jgi:hypothetical protein
MVRRRGQGAELSLSSYLGQYNKTQRNNRRRDSQEHRVQSGRSRVLASNWLIQGFQLRRGRRRILGGSRQEHMVRHQAAERGSVEK